MVRPHTTISLVHLCLKEDNLTMVWSGVLFFVFSRNHVTDYILEETAMPDELVRGVEGVEVFRQVLPQVNKRHLIYLYVKNQRSMILSLGIRNNEYE